ncbi:unnamed protein product [Cladocopium goreaui]|uniref:Uncharacterized protein n=1 Tax=Cladocopium goreaui TaxID=2562237 RepID=A0A9P1FV86_9DINO|nr:unnamed protein product [Cladocopium goreaui]
MHNFFSSGIASQECGLLLTRAEQKLKVTLEHVRNFVSMSWVCASSCSGQKLYGNISSQLLNKKLFRKNGGDIHWVGSASQTLGLMSLLFAFCHFVLVDFPDIQEEVESFVALHLVCLRVMHSKRDPKSMQGILQLQSDHLRKFVKAYSRDACRPKHHFQFHHEHQSMEVGYQFDCFCMERKNKAFKGGILPNISRIEDLERTALARWLQIDAASTLKNCPALYGKIDRYGDAAAAFSKYMKSTVGGWIGQGDFVLNPSEATCFYVQACQQQENIFYLLGLWLHHKGHGNEWVWSQWSWPNDVNHVSALAETRLVDFCKVTFAQDVDVITLIR